MIPLYSAEQVREADNYAINKLGIPGIVLMENASRSIVSAILERFPDVGYFDCFGIVCGKGNNGGDGFAVARHLINMGFAVSVVSIGKEKDLKGDALINYRVLKKMQNEGIKFKFKEFNSVRDLNLLRDCTFIIDAILGTGAKGELREPYSNIVNRLNSFDAVKIAIDLPTGLDLSNSTAGEIFESDFTVTLAEYKTGLFYGKGYKYAGEIAKGSIGIGPEIFDEMEIDTYLIEPEDAFAGLPLKETDIYKYSAGKVMVIAGSGNLPGAAILATKSAMRIGAGAVYLAFPKSIKNLAQQKLESEITIPYSDESKEFLSVKSLRDIHNKLNSVDVAAIGPGLGRAPETVEAVRKILKHHSNINMVLDADAIFAINQNYKNFPLKNRILTPHHREFADLLGISQKELENDLIGAGKKFTNETGAFLVLKGAPTIIFNPAGEVFINSTGNPGMAKFGTGDVLTGMIAGLLAQTKNIESSVITGVYLHSLIADLLLEEKTEFSINAETILDNIPEGIKFLRNSFVQET